MRLSTWLPRLRGKGSESRPEDEDKATQVAFRKRLSNASIEEFDQVRSKRPRRGRDSDLT